MTAGYAAMSLFDEKAVERINDLAGMAVGQINEAVSVADVPVSVTGAGSMFRIHLKESSPESYREAYQPAEETALIKELLDYLYMQEQIMMINTCTCMLSTAITEDEIVRLSEAMLNGFRHIKPGLDKLHDKQAAPKHA